MKKKETCVSLFLAGENFIRMPGKYLPFTNGGRSNEATGRRQKLDN
jgi:hypothetical protein